MKAQVITRENPFDPYLISTRLLHRPRKIRALRPRGKRPAIAMLNGKYILPHAWGRKLRDGDVLMFICLARGGGGGGSNPLRMLLTIALLAFAPWAAGIATGIAAGATGVQGLILAGTTMGIQLAGAALINALMPVPRQSTLPSPSPTYTLQARAMPRASRRRYRSSMAGSCPSPTSRHSPIGNMSAKSSSSTSSSALAPVSTASKRSGSRTRRSRPSPKSRPKSWVHTVM